MRIAMWSGPRNLSTAMMYSFASRADMAVWDEPFYAPYLELSGQDHPMRKEIIETHDSDASSVAEKCVGPIPNGKPHFYMKHMPHHMLDGIPMEWADKCVHVHLLRHPARVIASYGAKRDQVTLDDIGFEQQANLYDQIGGIVVDSFDIRQNPREMLIKLCAAIDLPFDEAMLSWKEGGRPEDGIWASHWYGAIHRSSGFAGAEGPLPDLTGDKAGLVEQALPYYEKLAAFKI